MNLSVIDPKTVGPRIRMMMPLLTPLEARAVDTILARRDFDGQTQLKTVAGDAGVSEAMIIKIAKKLGFEGFKDLRTALSTYNSLPTAELHQELSPGDTGQEIAEKVFRTSMHALEETLSIFDASAFERAADLIFQARQRDFYGIGGSAQIARDVSHKFLRIGIRTSVFDDAHMMLMSAALLTDGDVAIAFSHSGCSSAVLDAVELARHSGARTIALTNYAGSPLAKLADVVLCSTAQGSPLLGENAAARIAQLVIFDAVFAAVAQRDLQASERNLSATMNAVTNKRRTTMTSIQLKGGTTHESRIV